MHLFLSARLCGSGMKTVIHVLNTGSFSGAENVVIQIIHEMSMRYKEKYRFIYVALNGDIEERLREEGLEYRLFDKISISNLYKIKKELKPDVVHAHDFTASILCGLVYDKNVISHLHNNPQWIKNWNLKTLAYSLALGKYKQILLVSKAIANEFVGKKLQAEKVQVIGNPVNTKVLQENRSAEKKEYDLIFLGRFEAQKNPLRFVEIMKQMANKGKCIKAVMVGCGSMQAEVQAKISEYGLSDNIDMPGFVNNPWYYLNRSKIMCITSKWEGFGLMAVEGLAAAIPVVSTSVGGLTSILGKDNPLLCETDCDFVNSISRLLDEVEFYNEMVEIGESMLKKIDNIESYCKKMNGLYQSFN